MCQGVVESTWFEKESLKISIGLRLIRPYDPHSCASFRRGTQCLHRSESLEYEVAGVISFHKSRIGSQGLPASLMLLQPYMAPVLLNQSKCVAEV